MGNNSPAFKLLDGEVGGYAALQRELQRWRHRLPAAWVRAPVWPVILSTLIILGLLLVFHQVVFEAVQQSELRRKASAMHTEATWRCNSLRGPRASYSCLLRLNSAEHGDTMLQAQNTKLARE
jgi:hypothetical protein